MATWANLTQAERDAVLDTVRATREWAGMAARLANLGRAIAAKYSGNVETILSGLDAGTIPVYDADQGQQALTKSDLTTIVGYAIVESDAADNAAGSYNTAYHRGLFVKAAGIANTLQQGQS